MPIDFERKDAEQQRDEDLRMFAYERAIREAHRAKDAMSSKEIEKLAREIYNFIKGKD